MNKRRQRRSHAKLRVAPPDRVPAPEPAKSLFHYTSAAGLIGILQTQTLFATHSNFLNDTAECRLLIQVLKPIIAKDFGYVVPRLAEIGAFKPKIMEMLRDDILAAEGEKLAEIAIDTISQISPLFVTSFCMHEAGSVEAQHGLLSQWRGYGRGGFAIQFDEPELDRLTIAESETFAYQAMITRKVAYEDHAAAADHEKFVGIGMAAVRGIFEKGNPELAQHPEVSKLLGERDVGYYMNAVISALPFLKSPRFAEENEYRIVAAAVRPRIPLTRELPYKTISFRDGQSGALVPYIKLFDGSGAKLPIKKIIVGPHRDQENQYSAAKLLLEQCNIEAEVVMSDTTLRL